MAEVRVFLNPGATYGRGRERWGRVEPELTGRLGPLAVDEVEPGELPAALSEAVARGERKFVAAGGDGAVNSLVNAAMSLPEAPSLVLGAVGLGSSNDFHKLNGARDAIAGIPVRVDFENAEPCDVIRMEYDAPEDGGRATRYAIVNASVGVTAEANARFNAPSGAIRAARKLSVDAAISMSVLTTLLTWRDLTCALSTDGSDSRMVSVTNLGVFKNRHFGGALRYDFEVGRSDGKLGVALCEALSRAEVISVLRALRRGSFSDRPKTSAWTAETLALSADRPFALETDGEVARAVRVEFSVAPVKLRCCA